MKRMTIGIAAAALALQVLLTPAFAQGQTESRLWQVQRDGVLRVGMTGDYQPMTYRDTNTGEFIGHQVDIARELAKDLDVRVEFVPTDWRTIITGLTSGKYDIAMSGTSMSLARAKNVGMIDSWGMNAFVPIIRKNDIGKFNSWDDLNSSDRTAGVTLGTTMEEFIRAELPNAAVRRVEAPGTGWQEVLAGRVDYTVSTMIEASALSMIHDNLTMIFTDQPRNALPMTFLVPIEDPVWIHFLNNWVYLKKAAGYFDEVNEKWGVVLVR